MMKLVPLLSDALITVILYKKFSPKIALLWALNTAVIINTAMWGQTDAILALFMILMFVSMHDHKVKQTGIYFALCCLTKLQGIYFFPIYMLYLIIEKCEYKEKIKSFIYGLIVGIGVWLPFMIGSKDILLPFKIYLTGGVKYNQLNLGAANFWYFFVRQDYDGILKYVSFALLFLCIFILFMAYRKTKDILTSSMFYLFMIFMITFGQRERYCFYAMTALLLIYIYKKEKLYLYLYVAMFISISFNQIGNLINNNYVLDYWLHTNQKTNLSDFVFYTTLISLFINIILFLRIRREIFKKPIKKIDNRKTP